ncbi:MAG TPA: ribonuclease HII [Symbiobacteriaceae bacterium]|nr:ribonuclease HII [Symbiobacteriaceae bacterium]
MADLRLERVLWRRGFLPIGIDEAGRGPLAGPVVAAACLLPADVDLAGVNDSKKLSEKKREALFPLVQERALAWGIGVVDHARIDEINILNATFEAMRLAVRGLLGEPLPPEPPLWAEAVGGPLARPLPTGWAPPEAVSPFLLVDGNQRIREWTGLQRPVVGGDRKALAIAAASILAKVARDRLMIGYDKLYPAYGFAGHKGYSAPVHWGALDREGPCPIHRRSFLGPRQSTLF